MRYLALFAFVVSTLYSVSILTTPPPPPPDPPRGEFPWQLSTTSTSSPGAWPWQL